MRHRAHMSHSGVLLLVMVGMFVQPHCDLAQGWLPVSIYIVVVLRYW